MEISHIMLEVCRNLIKKEFKTYGKNKEADFAIETGEQISKHLYLCDCIGSSLLRTCIVPYVSVLCLGSLATGESRDFS